MLKFDYWCDLFDDQLPQLFTLFKDDKEALFYICSGATFVGAIHKINEDWQQIGGEEMPQKIINSIGRFIDGKTANVSSSQNQVYG